MAWPLSLFSIEIFMVTIKRLLTSVIGNWCCFIPRCFTWILHISGLRASGSNSAEPSSNFRNNSRAKSLSLWTWLNFNCGPNFVVCTYSKRLAALGRLFRHLFMHLISFGGQDNFRLNNTGLLDHPSRSLPKFILCCSWCILVCESFRWLRWP